METICLLFAYKIKYPENFFMLRGNHECANVNRIYGFYDECKRRYTIKLWKTFTDCFNCLPVAAIVDEKILCMHGGLSPDLLTMDQVRQLDRPTDVPDQGKHVGVDQRKSSSVIEAILAQDTNYFWWIFAGLLCDLLWSDPCDNTPGWSESERGISFEFGPDIVEQFLRKHDMELVCRAHQVVEDGYEFFARRRMVTLFSAPNYCGEFDNAGAMMTVDQALVCSFQVSTLSVKRPIFRMEPAVR